MQVYTKCHYILRTLQGDLEDTELWGLVSVLTEFTNTINSKRITESTHSGIHYTQRLWGPPEFRGKETRDEYTCWDNLQEWGRPGEQWVGFTVGRYQGLTSWSSSKPLVSWPQWKERHCQCLDSTHHFSFSSAHRRQRCWDFHFHIWRKISQCTNYHFTINYAEQAIHMRPQYYDSLEIYCFQT